MIGKKKIAVIGGGVSGLAAAKAFAERGHTVHGFERSDDFGGVWQPSRSYPGVQTQSPKDLYHYTDHPYPAGTPEWPTGSHVHTYLHSYAEKYDLAQLFSLNTSVRAMTRRADGKPGWTLTLEQDEQTQDEDFDFVSVCTGQFSDRNVAAYPGEDSFTGQVIHSSDYTDPEMVRGKHIVVLGGSKSGTDIAVNAANNGAASVTLVYRENVWRVPYYIGGINFKRLIYMRAQEQQFNGWSPSPVGRVLSTALKPLIWANFRGLEALLKLQLGLKKHGMVPSKPLETTVSCSFPIVTPGFFEALKAGTIKPVLGTIDSYDGGTVILSTGDSVPCDLAVMATGWKLGVPFLPDEARAALIEEDGLYRLYRLAVNPDLPDMGFVGFNSSFCTVLSAEMIANWLVRYADGQLANQPTPQQMNANIDMMQKWRREDRPAAQVYGGLCSAPFHFRHFDEVLKDIGATTRKRNPVLEQFGRPNAAAYGRFLASAPQYRAE